MSDRLKCARRLNELLESNFLIAKSFRQAREYVKEDHLKRFFQKRASKRYQYAIELSEEIGYLKEAYCSYGPFSASKKKLRMTPGDDLLRLLKVVIKNDKKILKEYRKAMSEVNEASTREILIRHVAAIEKNIRELKYLKTGVTADERRKFSLQIIDNQKEKV